LSKEDDQENKNQTAEDIARIMVENMKKNMEDSDFFEKKEKILQEAKNKVLKRREERLKNLKMNDE
jgi:6-pyruvoyl-tetrahydropterin synthase